MRLNSFHADVRELLNMIGFKHGPIMGDPRFAATPGTAAADWLEGRVPAAQLHYTINDAVGECIANRGDNIIVAPGYVEDLGDTSSSGAIDLDVAGISLIGLGRGSDMPRIDFNHADADFLIGAANIKVENIHFEATVTGVKIGISVEAAADYFEIKNCWFTAETAGTDEFLDSISIAAGANFGKIHDNKIDMGLAGAASGIVMEGASDGHEILRNLINGDFSVGCIEGATAASTDLDIGHNRLSNGDGSGINAVACIELNGNSTGFIYNNYCVCNLATKAASIVAAQCLLFENYYNEDVSGAATGGIIGTASADD